MKINGERPLVLAELRMVRRRWSWGRRAPALGAEKAAARREG